MSRYAEKTSVPVAKSKADIERILSRYGADKFAYGWDQERATIGFQLEGKFVKFKLELPDRNEDRFTHTPTGRERSVAQAEKEWEQGCRAAWRALCLVIHAKLEAVETGITSFENEFLAHILLPDGKTVGDTLIPQIETAYETGDMLPLLPYGG